VSHTNSGSHLLRVPNPELLEVLEEAFEKAFNEEL